MSTPDALPASGDGGNGQQNQSNTWGMIKAFAVRMIITYCIFSVFRRPSANPGQSDQMKSVPATNMYPTGTRMEMYAYLSESSNFSAFNDSSALFWHIPSLVYGDWKGGVHGDGSYSKHGYIDCVEQLIDNDDNGWLAKVIKFQIIPCHHEPVIEFNYTTNEYYPAVYLNDYWNMNGDYKPVNETTPVLELWLEMAPISLFKWQLYATQASKKSLFGNWFGDFNFANDGEDVDEDEQDTIKKTLVETNPWLLALTVVVSLVHSVFELLAFKNDIQFWKSRESLEGLSVRSIFFNVFQSLIVCLYVLDNQTNFVIIVSVFVGLGIEIWKINKVLNITVDHQSPRFLGLLPRIHVEYQSSYVESDTKKYDQMAFRYLSWVLFPMLAGYCVYSLVYQEHRGWYSWVLSMLYGFLLTFGFITMTPQLFINYKLKSVAHLPWRMLTYKALNTFIDDLFAFVIHMPTLYRIGCLRDDVIFFIYLYQRWIYPMDPNRVNEFGVSKEMLESKDKPKDEEGKSSATEENLALPPTSESTSVRRRGRSDID